MGNTVKIASAAFADTLVVGENERRLLELFFAEKRKNQRHCKSKTEGKVVNVRTYCVPTPWRNMMHFPLSGFW